MSEISVTVLDDMRLHLSPHEIARDSEHNSAIFRVTQPASLDPLVCRAEVQTNAGTTYRLVADGEFALTNDIAVAGPGRLQLVYSDGATVTRKTGVANFSVTGSINAIDPSNPAFGDGLAELQRAAFARAIGTDTTIIFYNHSGQPVGLVTYPPGSGEGLDEAAADLLYLRKDGGQMGGPLITARGTGVTNPGLGIGDNSTGFHRAGAFLACAVGGTLAWQMSAADGMMMGVTLNLAGQRITNVADATAAGDAANRRYVDAAIAAMPPARVPAPVILREVQNDIAVSQDGSWVALTTPITFQNPRGDSTTMCVTCMINATTGNVACANLRLNSQGTTLAERRAFLYGAQGSSGFTVQFYRVVVGTSIGPFSVEIQSIGGGSPAADFTVIGGIADGPRSQVAIYEVGPPP